MAFYEGIKWCWWRKNAEGWQTICACMYQLWVYIAACNKRRCATVAAKCPHASSSRINESKNNNSNVSIENHAEKKSTAYLITKYIHIYSYIHIYLCIWTISNWQHINRDWCDPNTVTPWTYIHMCVRAFVWWYVCHVCCISTNNGTF